jgi:uncharacterized protein (TIGR02996 family)
MSDEKALLAAIWEHPHEDTPRLMYADWLEERGKPVDVARAEFIRVQCELARLDEWDEDRRPALKSREEELGKRWAKRWRSHLPKQWKYCEFSRGFPKFDLEDHTIPELLKLTVAALEHAPLSRYHYNLEGPYLCDILKWPGLQFQELFSPHEPGLPQGWVKKVAACDALRNVSELCTIGCKLTPAEVRILLDAWADRHLPILRLAGKIGNEGMAVLASHPTAAKIRTLDLRGAGLTTTGIREMCASPYLTQVKSLDLSSNSIKDTGLKALLRWPHLSGVRNLILTRTKLSDRGAAALAECPALVELRRLHVDYNNIGAPGCRALARSPHLTRLTSLNLHDNPGAKSAPARKELVTRFGYMTVSFSLSISLC